MAILLESMLALFARKSGGWNNKCARDEVVGNRRILRSARMQPLEIRWETVIAFPMMALSNPCMYVAGVLKPGSRQQSSFAKACPWSAEGLSIMAIKDQIR